MGTSRTAVELSGKLISTAHAFPAANKTGLAQAALMAKEVMIANASSIGGLRVGGALPSYGKAKWGARFDWYKGLSMRGPSEASDDVIVRYIGPVHWAESGTKPHFITPRGAGGSRASRGRRAAAGQLFSLLAGGGSPGNVFEGLKQGKSNLNRATVLKIGDGFAMWAKHPGTAARHFWAPTKAQIAMGAPRTIKAAYRGALVRHFA